MKRDDVWAHLKRWPLLMTGLMVVILALGLYADDADTSDSLALLLGVGAVMIGSGLVLVVLGWEREGRHGFHRHEEEHGPDQAGE